MYTLSLGFCSKCAWCAARRQALIPMAPQDSLQNGQLLWRLLSAHLYDFMRFCFVKGEGFGIVWTPQSYLMLFHTSSHFAWGSFDRPQDASRGSHSHKCRRRSFDWLLVMEISDLKNLKTRIERISQMVEMNRISFKGQNGRASLVTNKRASLLFVQAPGRRPPRLPAPVKKRSQTEGTSSEHPETERNGSFF